MLKLILKPNKNFIIQLNDIKFLIIYLRQKCLNKKKIFLVEFDNKINNKIRIQIRIIIKFIVKYFKLKNLIIII